MDAGKVLIHPLNTESAMKKVRHIVLTWTYTATNCLG
jgi:hypothetical protein